MVSKKNNNKRPPVSDISETPETYTFPEKILEKVSVIDGIHQQVFELTKSNVLKGEIQRSYDHANDFLQLLSKTINDLEFFNSHILWEYVSEILPDDSLKEDKYTLRNINRTDTPKIPFKEGSKKKYPRNSFYYLEFSEENFSQTVLNYFNDGKLKKIFKLELDDEFEYFDLPIFSEIEADSQDLKLVGIITMILKKEACGLLSNDTFIKFMKFLSSQVGLAWDKFLNNLATKIQNKIDLAIGGMNEKKTRSRKEVLVLIAKILADEFRVQLCSILLANDQKKTLSLEASSIEMKENYFYHLVHQKNALTVKSYSENKNIRIFGRDRLVQLAHPERLKTLESQYKTKVTEIFEENTGNEEKNFIAIHWLSVVIEIGFKKLGLIKLHRIKDENEIDDDSDPRRRRPPFSAFETNILNIIQKHIFNIIIAHQTIEKRLEDMRNVFHQVHSPLIALASHSSNISRKLGPRNKFSESLDYIKSMSSFAINCTQNFQRIFDLTSGNANLYNETITDFRKYLIGIATGFLPMAQDKFIHVRVTDKTPSNLSLIADKGLLDHAVWILIDNAVKYSFDPEEREKIGLPGKPSNKEDKVNVLLTARERENDIVITISNWGVPIHEDEREHIFKREFRGVEAIDRAPNGTGIGLFIASEIIRLHGGKIKLLQRKSLSNTAFRITIPKGV